VRSTSLPPIRSAYFLHHYSSKDEPPTRLTQDVLNISDEDAATKKTLGEMPEIEQGTPVEEVFGETPGSQRLYSTEAPIPDVPLDVVDIHAGLPTGAKFPLPDLPLPPTSRLRHRYSPIVDQVTNLIMQDGKKARAQSVMTEALAILRTKPAPKSNPRIPIIPTAPPLESLPCDPVAFLQTAIDSVAPLFRIRSMKGSGGFRESIPAPLALQQRRRKAVMWILDAADKKKMRMGLAERLADEIFAVVEGRSSAWDRRQQVHKTAVAARANVKVKVL